MLTYGHQQRGVAQMTARDMTTTEFRAALKRNGFKLEDLFIAKYVSRINLKPHQLDTKIPCLYITGLNVVAKRATIAYAIKEFARIEADEDAALSKRTVSA
jgi:hypothetical protein